MRILLTGGSGMVGRNILADPRAEAHEIFAPARAELDLTDAAACRRFVAELAPDLVIHCAGVVGGIQANIDGGGRFLSENLAIGLSVVGAAHAARVPRLINLASSCVFPAGAQIPLREDRLLTGSLEPTNEGYALAKLATWKLVQAFGREIRGSTWRTLIPPNLYGRFDHFDSRRSHMMAAAILKIDEALRAGRNRVQIWGDGAARREFLCAADLADFIWRYCGRLDQLPETLNVGVGEDRTVDDYYRALATAMGYRGAFIHDRARPVGVMRKVLDVSGQQRLGWSPPTPLADGLAVAVAWFREARGL
ncbi:MAG: NAD-dependent epimerase/dehydratase family protein [Caulobacteraceae bacterium]|nr:NAD-dependent epimerase/dehydratase family protein [Caulobacteraceae bacterium]